jgi:hypothetical protein
MAARKEYKYILCESCSDFSKCLDNKKAYKNRKCSRCNKLIRVAKDKYIATDETLIKFILNPTVEDQNKSIAENLSNIMYIDEPCQEVCEKFYSHMWQLLPVKVKKKISLFFISRLIKQETISEIIK